MNVFGQVISLFCILRPILYIIFIVKKIDANAKKRFQILKEHRKKIID